MSSDYSTEIALSCGTRSCRIALTRDLSAARVAKVMSASRLPMGQKSVEARNAGRGILPGLLRDQAGRQSSE